MLARRALALIFVFFIAPIPVSADPPVASYIFPAGAQRGTTLCVRVGGINLLSRCFFEILGPGVEAPRAIMRTETTWFEGPLLPLPDSQKPEDYPKDHGAQFTIVPDAPIGMRAWRLWTSEGASGSLPFIIGSLPEVVEQEVDGDPIPTPVKLPVTINGRIFPREDVDAWSFSCDKNQVTSIVVDAAKLASPLDPWAVVLDPDGRSIAEEAPNPDGTIYLAFSAATAGQHTLKIHDVNVKGGQNYIYRITLTHGPSISQVFPLGGRRGSNTTFHIEGAGLSNQTPTVRLPLAGAGRGTATAEIALAPKAVAKLELDDLLETVETEPNDDPTKSSSLEIPGVGNGQINREADVDYWAVALEKDLTYELDLRSARLGSRLDALLSVIDSTGKDVAKAEGSNINGGDPFITIRPSASGTYRIRINDRFRSKNGSNLAYRLRITESHTPDFKLHFATDTFTIPRGGTARLKLECTRIGGYQGPIKIQVDGLPQGVSVAKTEITAGAVATELILKSEQNTPICTSLVKIRGISEKPLLMHFASRSLSPDCSVDSVRLAVALPTPFKISGPVDFGWSPRGTVRHRRYKLARNGFMGPLEIRLADRQARHLQGVTGPVVIVPPNAEEFEYPVRLPPWMEIGRTSRSVVMATGVVHEPDGSEHEVSYSSVGNEVQIAAVIGPGLLGLDARKTSIALAPGRTQEVPFKLARGKGIDGPVQISLTPPATVIGLETPPVLLKPGEVEGILRVTCSKVVTSPPAARAVLEARALLAGDPVTAETELTLVAEPGTNPETH